MLHVRGREHRHSIAKLAFPGCLTPTAMMHGNCAKHDIMNAAGIVKDAEVAVHFILNAGLPLLTAGEQAVASGVTSAANAVADEAVDIANDIASLGSQAVHGLTNAAIAAGAAIGGVAADAANAIAGAATLVANDIAAAATQVADTVATAATEVADTVTTVVDDVGSFFSGLFGRRLLVHPEQYLADLDYIEELDLTHNGRKILQEAYDLLNARDSFYETASTTGGRRHLLSVIETHAASNPVIERLMMYDGPQGSRRELLGFLDVVTNVVDTIASGTLYARNDPLTVDGCPDFSVDSPYPAN